MENHKLLLLRNKLDQPSEQNVTQEEPGVDDLSISNLLFGTERSTWIGSPTKGKTTTCQKMRQRGKFFLNFDICYSYYLFIII